MPRWPTWPPSTLGEPDSDNKGSNWSRVFAPQPVEAQLWFGLTGEYDGDSIQMIVGRATEDITDCASLPYEVSGCEDLEDGLLYWGEAIPEKNPGGVFIVQRKAQVTVRVSHYGPSFKGDPRQQDLPIDVQSLLNLAAN